LKIEIKDKKDIESNGLYKYLLTCINPPFEHMKDYAKVKKLSLNSDNLSECIFRTLISYAVIYSIGRRVFGKKIFSVFREDCGEFHKFCSESHSFANTFSIATMEKVL
jgi:hypothetical protein